MQLDSRNPHCDLTERDAWIVHVTLETLTGPMESEWLGDGGGEVGVMRAHLALQLFPNDTGGVQIDGQPFLGVQSRLADGRILSPLEVSIP